jgi:hypothetical protein
MKLEVGFIFTDSQTGFSWKIASPWLSRWRKQQIGWICQRAGFHPLQDPISSWKEHEILPLLNVENQLMDYNTQ